MLIDAAFDGIQDMKKIIDDTLTYDTSFTNHVAKDRHLLQRCRAHGISISQKKFVIAKQEVKYVEFIVNGEE